MIEPQEHPAELVETVARAFWNWNLENEPDAPVWDDAIHVDQETMRDGAIFVLDVIRAHESAAVTLSYCENHPETALVITNVTKSCRDCTYAETHSVEELTGSEPGQ